MTEPTKTSISTVVRKIVLSNIIVPIILFFLIVVGLAFVYQVTILKNQMLHKAQISSIAVQDYLDHAVKILRVYSISFFLTGQKQDVSSEEHYLVSTYFHNIVALDKNSNQVISLTLSPRDARKTYLPYFPFQESESLYGLSTVSFIPPYYSPIAKTMVLGIMQRYDSDYVFLGEVDLRRLWKFIQFSTKPPDELFLVDNFGNYIAHRDIQKIYRQENVGDQDWFANRKPLEPFFTIGYHEGSLVFIAGRYIPVINVWAIVLTPFWNFLKPVYFAFSFLLVFCLVFAVILKKSTQNWLAKYFILPFELFSTYVRKRLAGDHCFSPRINGFFPFYEGKLLEESFDQAMIEIYEQQKALRESEEKFRLIAETAPVGIFIFQDDRIVYANNYGAQITGYSEEELYNIVPFWKLVKEEYRDVVAYNATRRQRGILHERVNYEFPVITKGGEEKTIRASVSSTTYGGKPAGIIVICDITPFKKAEEEKRKLEAQLERTQRLESLGTLVAGISHEFNNILQAIALNIEHLAIKLAKLIEADDSWQRHIKDISVLHHRAANVVRELLAFTRAQQGERKEFSLHREINRVVGLSRQIFPRSIEIRTNLASTDVTVLATEGQIEQILLNLLNNAKDAIEDKGETGIIEIATELTSVHDDIGYGLPVGKYVKIIVRDNGIGMTPETMEKIFDPFFTTKPVGKGSGLGLSVVYGVVRQLGGSISCESRFGEGTEFTLFLPIHRTLASTETVEKKQEPSEEVAQAPKLLRILFVEDEPTVRNLMAEFLKSEGYEVDAASDPEEALRFIENSRYDLIITDLGLPGIGGEGLLKEINARQIKVPIIVASGYLHGKILDELHLYGVVISLTKPFTPSALRDAIRKVEKMQEKKFA